MAMSLKNFSRHPYSQLFKSCLKLHKKLHVTCDTTVGHCTAALLPLSLAPVPVMHGGCTVSLQYTPAIITKSEQQYHCISSVLRISSHPEPPHCPHSTGQHTTLFWYPGMPFKHTGSVKKYKRRILKILRDADWTH